MAPQRGYRRTHYVVDRRFQFKYTAFIVAIGAVIALICALFILKAWQENTELLAISQAIANEINRRESTKVFWMVGVFVLLEVVGLFFWGVVVTHRIAGPLFIIDRYLGALRSGFYPDMRPLRRSDELRQFFDSFSSTVDLLRERESEDIEAIAAALGTMPEGEAKDKLRQVQERKKNAVAGNKSADPAAAPAS